MINDTEKEHIRLQNLEMNNHKRSDMKRKISYKRRLTTADILKVYVRSVTRIIGGVD